jgi:hypothetical protein
MKAKKQAKAVVGRKELRQIKKKAKKQRNSQYFVNRKN